MNVRDRELATSETACPQCGALLAVPHQVDTFACSHCRSSLRRGTGLRVHRLFERPRVTREAAAGFLRGWFAGPAGPSDLEKEAISEVDGLHYVHFLRLRRTGADVVVALAPLPTPEVLNLGGVPAQFDGEPPAGAEEAGARVIAIDEDLLREELRRAAADPEVDEVLVERRAYYPVRYSYRGDRYTAAVEAGSGRVLAERRPARREVLGERRVAAGALLLLFAEAVLVPGLAARAVVIVVTAAGLYPMLRWAVARHG